MKKKLLAAAMLLAAVFAVPMRADVIEQVLVKVNGDIITKTELEQRQVAVLRQRMQGQIDPEALKNDETLKKMLVEVTPQVIVNAIDHGMDAQAAVDAPRLHFEDGLVYAEPGVEDGALKAAGRTIAWFRERNLFFGGCQAVERDAAGVLSGGGDPRRGGAVVVTPQ